MNIAVLFDGAGLARLGLEKAGHNCTGFELNKVAHYLSNYVGSGNCMLMDALKVDLSNYDAVWASPPCQLYSVARTQGDPESQFSDDLLDWALKLQTEVLWVENVFTENQTWGKLWNANQFLEEPIQNRKRIVGGCYTDPQTYRSPKNLPGVCPCILATEYKGCATDPRRASRFYGRKLTLQECAYHQGFVIPKEWFYCPYFELTYSGWEKELYHAIGNGVPVYMAQAFGESYFE